LYSQHTKAALQYSLEHPHLSVTYLNYSCTGAEVYEGILNAWWARDVSEAFWDDAPQMVKALRDLCDDPAAYKETQWSKGDRRDIHFNSTMATFARCGKLNRKIDALLLSIGGQRYRFRQYDCEFGGQRPESATVGSRPRDHGFTVYGGPPLSHRPLLQVKQRPGA